MNKFLLLTVVALLAVALLTHLIWLDKFPVGINHDEAEVVLSAKTYWLFGTDTSITTFPKSIFTNETAGGLSGLPSVLLAPLIGWQDFTLLVVRLPFVLLNIATLVLFALIAVLLTNKKLLGVIVFLVGLINPWFFAYSRATTEAPFALFFIALGTYMLFRTSGAKVLYSAIPFVLAFYSYFGAKPLIILLVPVLILLRYWQQKDLSKKFVLLFFSIFVIGVGVYFIYPKVFSGDNTFYLRSTRELVFSDLDRFASIVDNQRQVSLEFPFQNFAYNKFVTLGWEMLSKYFGWLTPDHLFMGGDNPSIYRFGEHGVLYTLDLIFIVLGIGGVFSLSKKPKRKYFTFLLLTFFLLAPIPSAVSKIGNSYFFRAFLLIPALIYLISTGIYTTLKMFNVNVRHFIAIIIILAYSVSFIYFLIFYFGRYPVKQQENHYLSGRILANYLARVDKEVIVITTSAHAAYHQYLFYSGDINQNQKIIKPKDNYNIGRIRITEECDAISSNSIVVVDARLECDLPDGDFLVIQNQKDAGFQYYIFGDKMCGSDLLPYRTEHRLGYYSVESLDNSNFCKVWIQKWQELN